jgi:hypothetical protein
MGWFFILFLNFGDKFSFFALHFNVMGNLFLNAFHMMGC